jgi:hypothetical protein
MGFTVEMQREAKNNPIRNIISASEQIYILEGLPNWAFSECMLKINRTEMTEKIKRLFL